jgi:hypothetical protein
VIRGRRRRLRRGLARLALAVVVFAGLYLVAVNLLLATPLGPSLLNRHPDRLQVTWRAAWSVLPGVVEVRGLAAVGRIRRTGFRVELDRASARVALVPLVRRRIEVLRLRGDGARVAVWRTPPRQSPRRARRAPWSIRCPAVTLAGLRELDLSGFRLLGAGRAEGAFATTTGGPFQLSPSHLEMSGVRLVRRGRELASGLALDATARSASFLPREHPGTAALDLFSGRLRAAGRMDTGGALRLELALVEGRLAPGTRLDLRRWGARAITARAVVVRAGGTDRLTVDAVARDLTLGDRPGRPPLARCAAARLQAATTELRASRLLAAVRRRGDAPLPGLVGAVEVEALELAFVHPRALWQVTADRARGRLDLAGLLRRRFAVAGLEARGIAVRAANLVAPPAPTAPAAPGPRRQPWEVAIADARLEEVREVAAPGPRGLRFTGAARAVGSFTLAVDRRPRLDGLEVVVGSGGLERGGDPLVQKLQGTLAIASAAPAGRGMAALLDSATGTLAAEGRLAADAFPALTKLRPGPLSLDLRVAGGRLLPGSRFQWTARRRQGPPLRLTGGVVAGAGKPRLDFATGPVEIGGEGGPRLRSSGLHLSAPASDLRLGALLDASGFARRLRGAARAPLPVTIAAATADDIEIDGVSNRLAWRGRCDRLHGDLDLAGLARREVHFTLLEATGARIQLDLRPAGGPRSAPPRAPWTVRLDDLRLADLRTLGFAAYRLQGPATAAARLAWTPPGILAIDRLSLAVAAGRLETGGETVARALAVEVAAAASPFAVAGLEGAEVLRPFSGTITVRGAIASLGFLDRALAAAPWLRLTGRGALDAALRLDRGRLVPGSRFTVRGAEIEAAYFRSRARGEATVTGTVVAGTGPDDAELRSVVDFDRFGIALREPADAPPHIRGRGFRLEIAGPADFAAVGRTAPGRPLRAALVLPEAEIVDLAAYNAYLPAGGGVEILSGRGRLRSRLDFQSVTGARGGSGSSATRGGGTIEIDSRAVRIAFQDVELTGDLALHIRLAEPDLARQSFALAGTELALDRVALRERATAGEPGEALTTGWWARLTLPAGTVQLRQPLTLLSTLELRMRDSGLLLALFSRRRQALGWFRNLVEIRDVTARGALELTPGSLVLDPLNAAAGRIDLRSRLRVSPGSRRGDLYVRWGRLSAGIELRDGRRTWHLRRPLAWFEGRAEE